MKRMILREGLLIFLLIWYKSVSASLDSYRLFKRSVGLLRMFSLLFIGKQNT